jgi:hypothetical protein
MPLDDYHGTYFWSDYLTSSMSLKTSPRVCFFIANTPGTIKAPAPAVRVTSIRPTILLRFVIVIDSPLYSGKARTLGVRPGDSLRYLCNQCI